MTKWGINSIILILKYISVRRKILCKIKSYNKNSQLCLVPLVPLFRSTTSKEKGRTFNNKLKSIPPKGSLSLQFTKPDRWLSITPRGEKENKEKFNVFPTSKNLIFLQFFQTSQSLQLNFWCSILTAHHKKYIRLPNAKEIWIKIILAVQSAMKT